MRIDLPCEIVKDLLPNYVDGLTSDSSTESVEQHLKQCKDCREHYETMKKNYHHPAERLDEPSAETMREKSLFQRINRKLNRKVRWVAGTGIAGVLLVAVLFYGLFNVAVKEVPVEDVTVSAHVYDMADMTEWEQPRVIAYDDIESARNIASYISKGEENIGKVYYLSIPDSPQISFTVTEEVMEDCPYVTFIEYSSPYYLRAIDSEYKNVNDERILYITGFRTTMLNNKTEEWDNRIATLDFSKVDKIVYVDDNQSETVLWEG